MKIFAVYNIKGGVGKTTTSVNLSCLSAADGSRTLLWDLDPQGGASYYMCVKTKIKGGSEQLLKRRFKVTDAVKMTGYPNLDLLPSDLSNRRMDFIMHNKKKPLEVLEKQIKPLRKQYDHLFLDCPPDLSMVAENVFNIADVLLVPLIPTTLSLRAYNKLVRFLVKNRTNKRLKVLPFFNQVNLTKPIHRVVTRNVREKHPIFLADPIIDSNIIEAMGIKRAPIFNYANDSEEAESFRSLWREIKERTHQEK
ncbi:MAG: ParA family protein [Magnetococcales bacterium]|nr:ParA family protein [Magnetococcales bacterium]